METIKNSNIFILVGWFVIVGIVEACLILNIFSIKN